LLGPGGSPGAARQAGDAAPQPGPDQSGLKPKPAAPSGLQLCGFLDRRRSTISEKKYDVSVELTSSTAWIRRSRAWQSRVQPDVTNITPDRLAQAVAGKLLGPQSRLYPQPQEEHLARAAKPFYDVGSLYTVPILPMPPHRLAGRQDFRRHRQGWRTLSIFWQSHKYKGYVGVLDDSREAGAGHALSHFYDINTENPAPSRRPWRHQGDDSDLQSKINITTIRPADRRQLAASSWSGSVLSAFLYNLPAGDDGSYLRYWSPHSGKGSSSERLLAVLATSRKPVLAICSWTICWTKTWPITTSSTSTAISRRRFPSRRNRLSATM